MNNEKSGVGYFSDIKIDLKGENLIDDNFLDEDGLHWSDDSEEKLINGEELGYFDDLDSFGLGDNFPKKVKVYKILNGTSGRITNVGRTKSGIILD